MLKFYLNIEPFLRIKVYFCDYDHILVVVNVSTVSENTTSTAGYSHCSMNAVSDVDTVCDDIGAV